MSRRPAWAAALLLVGCAAPQKSGDTVAGMFADKSALIEAVRAGDDDAVRRLLERGAPVEASDTFGDTPLIYAAMTGDQRAADLLLKHDARVDARDSFRQTALLVAAQHGDAAMTERLLRAGARVGDVDRFGRDALMYAAIYDQVPVAKLLMAAGGDPNARDPWGSSALSFAAEHGFQGMVRTLLPRAKVSRSLIAAAQTAGQDEIARELSAAAGRPFAPETTRPRSLPLPQPAAPAAAQYSDADAPPPALPADARKFALVVGVENYLRLPEASYAARDAQTIKDYLVAMGYPRANIVALSGPNATRAVLQGYLEEWLPRNLGPDSEFFLYFSGHGATDPVKRRSYLVPWDGNSEFLDATAYPLDRLYADLAKLRSRTVVAALDACFSGRGARSVAPPGRPLVTEASLGEPLGRARVLAAASANQIAAVLPSEGHGLFTYYLLRGLQGAAQDKRGGVTLDALFHYLSSSVPPAAARQNLTQTPRLLPSSGPDATLVRWAR